MPTKSPPDLDVVYAQLKAIMQRYDHPGWVCPLERPGFGIELDERVGRRYRVSGSRWFYSDKLAVEYPQQSQPTRSDVTETQRGNLLYEGLRTPCNVKRSLVFAVSMVCIAWKRAHALRRSVRGQRLVLQVATDLCDRDHLAGRVLGASVRRQGDSLRAVFGRGDETVRPARTLAGSLTALD